MLPSAVVKGVQRTMMMRRSHSSAVFRVQHDTKLTKFYVQAQEDRAELTYRMAAPDTLDLEHTVVPPSLRGKGVGALLAEAALDFAVDEGLKVKVSCDFIQHHLYNCPRLELDFVK